MLNTCLLFSTHFFSFFFSSPSSYFSFMFGCQIVNVSPSPWQPQRGPGDAQINPRWECWVPAYKQVKIQSCESNPHCKLPPWVTCLPESYVPCDTYFLTILEHTNYLAKTYNQANEDLVQYVFIFCLIQGSLFLFFLLRISMKSVII